MKVWKGSRKRKRQKKNKDRESFGVKKSYVKFKKFVGNQHTLFQKKIDFYNF